MNDAVATWLPRDGRLGPDFADPSSVAVVADGDDGDPGR